MRERSGRIIDLRGDESKPIGQRWRRVRMIDLVYERLSWKFDKRPLQQTDPDLFHALVEADLEDAATELHERIKQIETPFPFRESLLESILKTVPHFRESAAKLLGSLTPQEQLVDVYERFVEPNLIDPVFVTHVPSVIIPLARPSEEDPYFAEVYELAINGQEISPGYTELNDPDVQEQLFRAQVGDEAERQQIDEDFLTALRYGMPPAGGMGLGVDRLVAMLTGAPSLRDVILFPLMRPRQE